MFYFHPETWGFMIQFYEHIFQMGGKFNHQLVNFELIELSSSGDMPTTGTIGLPRPRNLKGWAPMGFFNV